MWDKKSHTRDEYFGQGRALPNAIFAYHGDENIHPSDVIPFPTWILMMDSINHRQWLSEF